MPSTIVWFRQDLRISDQPALATAIARGGAVVPIYIEALNEANPWAPGAAHRWWLHYALLDLDRQLAPLGLKLIVRRGKPVDELRAVAANAKADHVYWSRRYESFGIQEDSEIKRSLREQGIEVRDFNSSLLFEPWECASQAGRPYKVFTPFSKNVLARCLPEPVEHPSANAIPALLQHESLSVEALDLLPEGAATKHFEKEWDPTRGGAITRLEQFVAETVDTYHETRDFPAMDGTSRLSPYLHWGQLGPREIVAALSKRRETTGGQTFLREILWREFAYHVLYHFPHTPNRALQPRFQSFPWKPEPVLLNAWKDGRTGYPIIDAAMRQLRATGWMHNRLRMVVASFLVKHLLQPWQEGARWFWDNLIDGDLANNTLGWQWAGGCGADAAPYFRIFNPITQGERFDKTGAFVRQWIPELASLPDRYIHQPWTAPATILKQAAIELGKDYPHPIVEHTVGRERALQAFAQLKEPFFT